jgi:hypothetical protein
VQQSSIEPATLETAPSTWLLVPVDATQASYRVLTRAIALAGLRRAGVVLIGLLGAAAEGLDPEAVAALLTAAEFGYGVAVPRVAEDHEARLTRLVRLVLVPYQRRIEAAGVAVRIGVLPAERASEQLRAIVATLDGPRQLVLGNPVRLEGALQAFTLALLAEPPCAVLVVEHDDASARKPSRLARLGALLPGRSARP